MKQKDLLFSVSIVLSSFSVFSQKVEVKKDVIYADDVAVAGLAHHKSSFFVTSTKGDTLFTITLKREGIYYYDYDFPAIGKTVKSVDFYTKGSSRSDSAMSRYQNERGLYAVVRSESHYVASKIVEYGLVKNGQVDPEGVELFHGKNPDEIVDRQLAGKAGSDSLRKVQDANEARVLAAVSPSVDDKGNITNGSNNSLGHIEIGSGKNADIPVRLFNQNGQLVASGTVGASNVQFATSADQQSYQVGGVNRFDLEGDFMRKRDGMLKIVQFFVKKGYLK